jgi:hypothetical protein
VRDKEVKRFVLFSISGYLFPIAPHATPRFLHARRPLRPLDLAHRLLLLLRTVNPTWRKKPMKPIRRGLLPGLALCALMLAGTRAWGSPILGVSSPATVAQAQDQPKQDQAPATTFTGTIAKDGDDFVLRDSSGATFKLDDTERAKPFEGKAVKVTGHLDADARLIHVDNIEPSSASAISAMSL